MCQNDILVNHFGQLKMYSDMSWSVHIALDVSKCLGLILHLAPHSSCETIKPTFCMGISFFYIFDSKCDLNSVLILHWSNFYHTKLNDHTQLNERLCILKLLYFFLLHMLSSLSLVLLLDILSSLSLVLQLNIENPAMPLFSAEAVEGSPLLPHHQQCHHGVVLQNCSATEGCTPFAIHTTLPPMPDVGQVGLVNRCGVDSKVRWRGVVAVGRWGTESPNFRE